MADKIPEMDENGKIQTKQELVKQKKEAEAAQKKSDEDAKKLAQKLAADGKKAEAKALSDAKKAEAKAAAEVKKAEQKKINDARKAELKIINDAKRAKRMEENAEKKKVQDAINAKKREERLAEKAAELAIKKAAEEKLRAAWESYLKDRKRRNDFMECSFEVAEAKGFLWGDRFKTRYGIFCTSTKILETWEEFGKLQNTYEVQEGSAVNCGPFGPFKRRVLVTVLARKVGGNLDLLKLLFFTPKEGAAFTQAFGPKVDELQEIAFAPLGATPAGV